MCAMKNLQKILLAAVIAVVASGCTSAYFSQVSTYDDLYATHDVKAIADICHRHDVKLIVDGAHGSHLKACGVSDPVTDEADAVIFFGGFIDEFKNSFCTRNRHNNGVYLVRNVADRLAETS